VRRRAEKVTRPLGPGDAPGRVESIEEGRRQVFGRVMTAEQSAAKTHDMDEEAREAVRLIGADRVSRRHAGILRRWPVRWLRER